MNLLFGILKLREIIEIIDYIPKLTIMPLGLGLLTFDYKQVFQLAWSCWECLYFLYTYHILTHFSKYSVIKNLDLYRSRNFEAIFNNFGH